MKILSLTLFLALISSVGFAQNKETDSLKHELAIAKVDTSRVLIMAALADNYRLMKPDSAMKYAQNALILAQKIKFSKGEGIALNRMGGVYRELGDLPKAMDFALKALRIAEEHQYFELIENCNNTFGIIYYDLQEFPKAIFYYKKANKMAEKIHNQKSIISQYGNIGAAYIGINQLDSGMYYTKLAYEGGIRLKLNSRLGTHLRNWGRIEAKLGNNQRALDYFKQSIQASNNVNDPRNASYTYNELAKFFLRINQTDSCIVYAKKGLAKGQMGPFSLRILESSTLLAQAYKAKNDLKQAYEYQELMVKTKESLFGAGNIQTMQAMIAGDEARRKEAETEQIANKNKLRQYGLLAGLAMFLLISFILFRNNRQKQKANKVLENTLTDLKTSQTELEIKNRDLEIEGALERIRAIALAMQNSNELIKVADIMREQMGLLGQPDLETSAVHLYKEDSDSFDTWFAFRRGDRSAGEISSGIATFKKDSCEIVKEFVAAYYSNIDTYTLKLEGQKLEEWRVVLFEAAPVIGEGIGEFPSVAYFHFSDFSGGSLLMVSYKPPSDEAKYLQKRCANVFDLAYRRFLDLQKAEVQAKEAEIELSLEKVRSRSMAMHKSDELHEVIKVIFEQLINLNFKIDSAQFDLNYKDSDDFDFWTAIPSQPYPFKLHIPYFDHPFLNQKRVAKENGLDFSVANYTFEEKNLYFQHLFEYNPLIPEERKKYILNCSGMAVSAVLLKTISLWAGNYNGTPFSEEENAVLKRFAIVFEQAYTRFLDLQKAEAQAEQAHRDLILIQTEKKRAEDALSILKATQNQLIQSEKLASLGELTAGIAHEIQNPLNFVNNFAEMSVDLAKELKEEVEKPEIDKELIIDLANDLSQNQEKINLHGKRASSIVTGMLQHSQASSGKKELTDLNKLADESLRLSYHGLRAKDKSFNSDFELIADPNLPKINVIPQDIGRVLINLINNAFYACSVGRLERHSHSSSPEGSKPLVLVSTEKTAGGESHNQIIIKVTDNGTGMSEATKAKIFQPFFTTKPTGQGTGLGLSLAYDIITKGHGGTIECESVEGEGTTFIVKLPT